MVRKMSKNWISVKEIFAISSWNKKIRTREKRLNINFGKFGLLSSSGDSFYVMDIFISNLDNLSKLYFDISSFWHSRIISFQISSIR